MQFIRIYILQAGFTLKRPCTLYVQLEHHNGGSTRYTLNFRNSVLEGNISQVVVINNELLNPIQLNIETLSRHELKCMC